MPTRTPKQARETFQLTLLLDADRITGFDTKARTIIVNLLARLLLEATPKRESEEVDDEA